jgi:hypothetical protein
LIANVPSQDQFSKCMRLANGVRRSRPGNRKTVINELMRRLCEKSHLAEEKAKKAVEKIAK